MMREEIVTAGDKILVVDDDERVLQTFSRNLTLAGHRVVTASNGHDALRVYERDQPDIALVDVRMPQMDGFQLLAAIHEREPEAEVILVTGHGDMDMAIEALRAGASDFIPKPIVQSVLQTALRRASERLHLKRELRSTQEALRASEEHYRAITEAAFVGVGTVDLEENITYVNQSFAEMLGYSRPELLGQNLARLTTPAQFAAYREQTTRRREGLRNQYEAMLLRQDGASIDVLISAAPLRDAEGEVHGTLAVVSDISERKRSEDALRQYAEKQAALYAIASAISASLDPDKLLSTVLDMMLPLVGSQAGWVMLPDSRYDNRPYVAAWRGIEEGSLRVEKMDSLPVCGFCTHLLSGGEVLDTPQLRHGCPLLSTAMQEQFEIGDMVLIPLTAGRDLLGLLEIAWPRRRPYTEADGALLTAVGQQIGIALNNAQLYQSARQVDRLRVLNSIGAAAVSSLELDVVLRHVLELTCQALDAAEGSILLRTPEADELVFALTLAGETSGLRGQRISIGQGIAGWVAQHGRTVRVNDVREDVRFYDGIDALIGFETRSLLCTPLQHRDEITGVIEIVNKRKGGFTDEDATLLEAVSAIAAASLANARLFSTTRARADELALLNEIGLALTSTLDSVRVIHSALHQVQRLFHAEGVLLLEPHPQTGELCFVQAVSGPHPVDVPLCLQPGEGLAGWALQHREPALVQRAADDPRFSDQVDRYLNHHTRSLMAVPLLSPNRAIGVIEVSSREEAAYTLEDLRLLQSVASTLTIALENAHLYEEIKTVLREREQAQAQLIHAEKMSALGRLVASIAHEINNPLQSVQGCLTLVEEELQAARCQEKLERYLNVAEVEIQRISAIVRRMRDFYRPARAGFQEVQVCDVLESVLELTNKQLQHSAVTVVREWDAGIPAVRANPDHLKQVFLNLVLNAIDAMPTGGTLHVTVSDEAQETAEGSLPMVCVAFRDSGIGMSQEVLSRLFEPFFTTKEHGSGLGLSISYGIIESHQGWIRVESRAGEGTTFLIYLPQFRHGQPGGNE